MKQLAFVIVMLAICGVAFAEQTGWPDGGPVWAIPGLQHTHEYTDNNLWVDRYSEYQLKQKMPIGIGADVIVYQPDLRIRQYTYLDSVNVESKYDIANNKGSVYFVAHFNLWEAVQDILK